MQRRGLVSGVLGDRMQMEASALAAARPAFDYGKIETKVRKLSSVGTQ